MQTKSVVLNRWLSVMPESAFADKPMVEMFYISVLLGVGEWKAAFRKIEQALIRFAALKEQLNEADWKRAMGNIYFFCSIVSYLHKDLNLTSDYLERVEQYMPEGSFFKRWDAIATKAMMLLTTIWRLLTTFMRRMLFAEMDYSLGA